MNRDFRMKSNLRNLLISIIVSSLVRNVAITKAFPSNFDHNTDLSFFEDYEDYIYSESSLVFVVDITGSMGEDLQQLKDEAAGIIASAQSDNDEIIYNFILIPFSDPDVGPITITTDPIHFQNSLNAIKIKGGGDCPETSISAIKIALQISLPHSSIFVLTDARAKDYNLTDQVIDLIQKKQSKIYFLLTGSCGNKNHPGYTVFNKLAAISSGQKFEIVKSQVKNVLNFVKTTRKFNNINIASIEKPFFKKRNLIKLLVDSTISEFTISVIGHFPKITVLNPQGVELNNSSNFSTVLDLSSAQVITVKNVVPGIWLFKTNLKNAESIRVTASSDLDFNYGFSTIPVDQMFMTYEGPIKGHRSFVLISILDTSFISSIHHARLLNIHGRPIIELPTSPHPSNPRLYTAPEFHPPSDHFFLQIEGEDTKGYTFKRITSSALKAIDATPPVVFCPEVLTGFYGFQTILSCEVFSPIPFVIQWQRDGFLLDSPTKYESSYMNVTKTVKNVSGKYACNVTNQAGWNASFTSLHILEPTLNTQKPIVVQAFIGEDVSLDCLNKGLKHEISWQRYDSKKEKKILIDKKKFHNIEILKNGSLIIKKLERQDGGLYICKTFLHGGYTETSFYLQLDVLKLSVFAEQDTFTKGSTITLQCLSSGRKMNKYRWLRNNELIKQNKRLFRKEKNELVISGMTQNDAGKWVCEAETSKKKLTASIDLHYLENPKILNSKDKVVVVQNQTAFLNCSVSGFPKPEITWTKNHIELQEFFFIRMDVEGGLWIDEVQRADAGEYICEAYNIAGSDRKLFHLDVDSPPEFVNMNKKDEVIVKIEGSSLNFECDATGHPIPNTTWFKNNKEIIGKDNFKISKKGALKIIKATEKNQGNYTCEVTNRAGSIHKDYNLTILTQPKLIDEESAGNSILINKETKAELHGSVSFDCLVHSNPLPQIKWYKNGEKIKFKKTNQNGKLKISEGRMKLEIKNVDEHDSGRYTCIAKNIVGKTKKNFDLKVFMKPYFDDTLPLVNTVFASLTNTSLLNCSVQGIPIPHIMWFKDGKKLQKSKKLKFWKENQVLEIRKVEKKDAGFYSCFASNSAGVISRNYSFEITAPSRITLEHKLTNVEKLLKDKTELHCPVEGFPLPTVSWRWNNLNLEKWEHKNDIILLNNNSILKISESDLYHAGIFTCRADNGFSQDEKHFVLKINEKPQILQNGYEKSLKVLLHTTFTLDCEVKGNPEPKISWSKDNYPLESNAKVELLSGGMHLRVSNASTSDAGIYTCLALNKAGRDTVDFTVDVLIPASIATTNLNLELTFMEKENFQLMCPGYGNPKPLLSWFLNGDKISNINTMSNIRILNEGEILEIVSSQTHNGGSYICRSENEAGYQHIEYIIKILEKPKISSVAHASTLKVLKGEIFLLECLVKTHPVPEISWSKDNYSLASNAKVELLSGGMHLRVSNASTSDAGIYTCLALNKAGRDTVDFTVNVLVPAKIDMEDLSLEKKILEGSEIQLDCPAFGYPIPKISWFKDGNLILQENEKLQLLNEKKLLKIKSGEKESAGTYACRSENEAGFQQILYDVKILEKPKTIYNKQKEIVKVIENENFLLECVVSGNPLPEISWSKDNYPLESNAKVELLSGGMHLRVSNASTSDAGIYTCLALNKAGSVAVNFTVNVLVPVKISNQNLNLEVTTMQGEAFQLECPVSGNPNPKINWFRNGNDIGKNTLVENVMTFNEGRVLRVLSSTSDDAGLYVCRGENEAGFKQIEYNVEIFEKPKIDLSKKVDNSEVIENQNFVLECMPSGHPLPEISWSKDNYPLESNAKVELLSGGMHLRVSNASTSDAGIYTCLALNKAGRDTVDFTVNVLVPAAIVVRDLNFEASVIQGQTIQLDCPTIGDPKPIITWFKNGERIFHNESYQHLHVLNEGMILKILSSQKKDAGSYVCRAENDVGFQHIEYHVETIEQPKIIMNNPIEPLQAVTGGNIVLECLVDVHPLPEISWSKDNYPLESNAKVELLSGGMHLRVSNASTSDAGIYTCLALNKAGRDTVDFTVNVLVPVNIDEKELELDKTIIQGRTIRLECPFYGDPEPLVTWSTKGKKIENDWNSQRVKIYNEGKILEIASIEGSDSGTYVCTGDNKVGFKQVEHNVKVIVSPIIDDSPSALIVVEEHQRASFKCRVLGEDITEIQWLYNSEFLSENEKFWIFDDELTIISVIIEDAGMYTCVAKNEAGAANRNFELLVLVTPKIVRSETKDKIILMEEQTIDIECLSSGIPEPSIQWRKLQEEASNLPSHFETLYSGKILRIVNIKVSDAGTYVCQATNSVGKASKVFELEVQVPPLIESNEDNVVGIEGEEIKISCLTSGFPLPEISWKKNLEDIGSDPRIVKTNSGTLQVFMSQSNDSGVYRCIAINPVGIVYKDITLKIQTFPKLLQKQSSTISVRKGLSIDLPCLVEGDPTPTISWSKGPRKLIDRESHRKMMDNSWRIENVELSDSGNYICHAQNNAGSITAQVSLEVHDPTKIIPVMENTLEILENQSVNLPCSSVGSPRPSITWFKDEIVLKDHIRYQVLSDYLSIINARPEDAGDYTCVANNTAGSDSFTFKLLVQVPPKVLESVSEITVFEGEEVELPCSVQGIPAPSVRWLYNGVTLTTSHYGSPQSIDHHIVNHYPYIIKNAKFSDRGSYVCIVFNVAGKSSKNIQLNVLVAPEILIGPEDTTTVQDSTVDFYCQAKGNSLPKISWLHNDLIIQGDSQQVRKRIYEVMAGKSRLRISQVSLSDEGKYTCIASNEAGNATVNAHLSVKIPPIVLMEKFNEEVNVTSSVILHCPLKQQSGEVTFVWTKNFSPINYNGQFYLHSNGSLHIYNTKSEDTGLYRCSASNDVGLSEGVINLIVKIPLKFTKRPANIDAKLGDTVVIDCEVQGDSEIQVHWTKDEAYFRESERISFLSNNSLRILAVQFYDAGQYECIAKSSIASIKAEMRLNVKQEDQYGAWSEWSQCSTSCGEGRQTREKFCVMFFNEIMQCETMSKKENRMCVVKPCPIDGQWSVWEAWTGCSSSCGTGKRNRKRNCNNPYPLYDGRDCVGYDIEEEYCNEYECPIHGGWTSWSDWSECTMKCGGGKQKRSRTCTQPVPNHSGRNCIGVSEEIIQCNGAPCAEIGWKEWSDWGECSTTCGEGTRTRTRTCTNILNKALCVGENTQVKQCDQDVCKEYSVKNAVGKIEGQINDNFFEDGLILTEMTNLDGETSFNSDISGVSLEIKKFLRSIVVLNLPVYWMKATEIITLDNPSSMQDLFTMHSQAETNTGGFIDIVTTSLDINERNVLRYKTKIHGNLSEVPFLENILIDSYSDRFIKTGPNSIQAFSTSTITTKNFEQLQHWNHSITYNHHFLHLPHLINDVEVNDISIKWEPGFGTLNFLFTSHLVEEELSEECPRGFDVEPDGEYCLDEDECMLLSPCSHSCLNNIGSFVCTCPIGFELGPDAQNCLDMNECENEDPCQHNCLNTPGSFHCECFSGYQLMENNRSCIDMNECANATFKCPIGQRCLNEMGSYQCIDLFCPEPYEKDLFSGECVVNCTETSNCSGEVPNVLIHHLISVPADVTKGKDLIFLSATDQQKMIPLDNFEVLSEEMYFDIRLENGKGMLNTLQTLEEGRLYTVVIEATSMEEAFNYTFVVYVLVSNYHL